MERHLDKDLDQLNKQLLQMSALVEEAISRSIKALVTRQEDLATRVIHADQAINMLELKIDRLCLRLLALHQPAAVDMRFVTSVMKINSDLERIADQAVNIAHRTQEIIKQPPLKPLIDIPYMATLAKKMVKDAIDALVNKDEALARDVCKRDNEVDCLNRQIFRKLLTYMMQEPKIISLAVELVLVGRHLERIADHATNIAEDVIYYLEGKNIKHCMEINSNLTASIHQI